MKRTIMMMMVIAVVRCDDRDGDEKMGDDETSSYPGILNVSPYGHSVSAAFVMKCRTTRNKNCLKIIFHPTVIRHSNVPIFNLKVPIDTESHLLCGPS